jgi:hypothetical protein
MLVAAAGPKPIHAGPPIRSSLSGRLEAKGQLSDILEPRQCFHILAARKLRDVIRIEQRMPL